MCWALYLSYAANPFSDAGSFEEFQRKLKMPVSLGEAETEQGINDKQMQGQLDKADQLLRQFVPPVKGG